MLKVPPVFAARLVLMFQRLPNPPRRFSTIESIKQWYLAPMSRSAVLFGVGALGLATFTSLRMPPDSAVGIIVAVIVYGGGAALVASPAAFGALCAYAVRHGRLVRVRVVGKNGEDWLVSVPHAHGTFQASISPNRGWSSEIGRGAEIGAVVHPAKPKVLLVLGPLPAEYREALDAHSDGRG